MKEMKIPGYRPLIANEVFKARSKDISCSGEKYKGTNVIVLSRFVVPNSDDVINFIIEQARITSGDYPVQEDAIERSEALQEIFYHMTPPNIKELARGEQKDIIHLRKHGAEENGGCRDLQRGATYIDLRGSDLLDSHLQEVKKRARDYGSDIYFTLSTNLGVRKWRLLVRLVDDKAFPKKEELEFLVDREVTDCNIFKVQGDNNVDYNFVRKQLIKLAGVLDSEEKVQKVNDRSYKLKENMAARTLEGHISCGKGPQILQSIMGGAIILNLGSKEEQKKGPNLEYVSLN
jgi:hypothetical protein